MVVPIGATVQIDPFVLGHAGAPGFADRGDDDGRGLSAAERAQVSRRGQRLDESTPGSGLGLSIVVDLAAIYGGSLQLEDSPLGGLRASLRLPGL